MGEALYKYTGKKRRRRGEQIARKGVRPLQVAKTRDIVQPLVSERRAALARGDRAAAADLSTRIQAAAKKSGFYTKAKGQGGRLTAKTAPKAFKVSKAGPISATKQKKTAKEFTKGTVRKKAAAFNRKQAAAARKQQKTLKVPTPKKPAKRSRKK